LLLSEILTIPVLLAEATAIVYLWRTGLHRRYPVWTWYLVLCAASSAAVFAASSNPWLYANIWLGSLLFVEVGKIAVFAEIYRLAKERYPGIGRLAGVFAAVALAISYGVSAAAVSPQWSPRSWRTAIYHFALLAREWDAISLVFALAIVYFGCTRLYHQPPRNLLRHLWVFAAYLLADVSGSGMVAAFRISSFWPSIAESTLRTACIAAWIYVVRPDREFCDVPRDQMPPEESDRIDANWREVVEATTRLKQR
jgi:hypothetical protein